jgi:hypothetical protein
LAAEETYSCRIDWVRDLLYQAIVIGLGPKSHPFPNANFRFFRAVLPIAGKMRQGGESSEDKTELDEPFRTFLETSTTRSELFSQRMRIRNEQHN